MSSQLAKDNSIGRLLIDFGAQREPGALTQCRERCGVLFSCAVETYDKMDETLYEYQDTSKGYATHSTGNRTRRRHYTRILYSSIPRFRSGFPGLVYRIPLSSCKSARSDSERARARNKERKGTYVNFSSSIICIRSVLPWGCDATCGCGIWGHFCQG
jgi:hypothetical protein